MQCPLCQHARTRVCDSRSLVSASFSSSSASSSTRRKRECLSCGASFFTLERAEDGYDARNLWVLKNDGGEERFAADKLTASLRACLAFSERRDNERRDNERRENEIVASLSDKICETLRGAASDGSARVRITSRAIDLSARRFLREHDFAAYVRYASVSGGFRGLDDFTDFLATERATNPSGQAGRGQAGRPTPTNPSERE